MIDFKSLPARYLSKIVFEPTTGCWLWDATSRNGYCSIRAGGRYEMVHRSVYKMLVGPIPEGLTIDHLCRNRCCVNPDHLEPVTMIENLARGRGFGALNSAKTHCKRGHPLSGANLYVTSSGSRGCRTCWDYTRARWRLANADRYRAWDAAYARRRRAAGVA